MVIELDAQGVQIVARLIEDALEDAAVAGEARRARAERPRLVRPHLGALGEGPPGLADGHAVDDGRDAHLEGVVLVRWQAQLEDGVIRHEVGGRHAERHDRLVRTAVEAGVPEDDRGPLDARPLRRAPPRPLRAAHLEDVGEVGGEADDHADLARPEEKVREDELLDEPPVEDLTTADVEEVRRVLEELFALGVAEHQVDLVVRRMRRVGPEADRPAVDDLELVVGEKPRVLVEETELARARRRHVPLVGRHDEHRPPGPDEALAVAGDR